MKVVLVCQKSEFDRKRVRLVEKHASVTWVDNSQIKLSQIPSLQDSEEKILALSPVPIGWKVPNRTYAQFNNVKYICLVTTDYSFIDLGKCSKAGIKVTNIPHYATEAVAENAIFMMMGLLRRLPAQIKGNFKYEFTNEVLSDEFAKKSVGIIGLGNIGRRIAEIATNLGMETRYWSLHRKKGFRYMKLGQLLAVSDVIFPTVASNPETVNFLNRKLLSKMKHSTYFVSIVNEKIWDKKYLIERAEKGRLAGLAYESETSGDKLTDFKGNVLALPPLAWYSSQSLENNIQIWAETIISALKGKAQNLVN